MFKFGAERLVSFENDEGFGISVGNEYSAEQPRYCKIFCAYGVSVIAGNRSREEEAAAASAGNHRHLEDAVFKTEDGFAAVGKDAVVGFALFTHVGKSFAAVIILKERLNLGGLAHKVIARLQRIGGNYVLRINGSAGKKLRVFFVAVKSGIEIIVERNIVIVWSFYIFLRGFRGGRRRGGRLSR